MATTNGSTAIRDKILASLARYRALRIGKFPCAFWRLSARPGLTAAENQTVNFGLGLTVVYGDNAAGKSGYTRIFKSACRTRGTEYILGNVASGSAPVATSVEIKYSVGDNGVEHVWAGEGSAEPISRVSVFDSHSATVYLTEKN
ncbi:hypothetical protein BPLS_P4219 [Bathymodiolus platifrons methanotrophic gill symbiont]|uniref:ATP-binding protein n=1 Tax=Bathymodiolus platifrons methanotrophic gill symbiont TaxID=113268 RepID=UPI001B6ADE1B|nr:ATP-binding protein [Bathymodiolus platifrons methanotrophic gill symbiont]GFO76441.1 hypothetical protein BPLS_P4219 [Bathymodiolus platifrons methanotrophic gill symbiont]